MCQGEGVPSPLRRLTFSMRFQYENQVQTGCRLKGQPSYPCFCLKGRLSYPLFCLKGRPSYPLFCLKGRRRTGCPGVTSLLVMRLAFSKEEHFADFPASAIEHVRTSTGMSPRIEITVILFPQGDGGPARHITLVQVLGGNHTGLISFRSLCLPCVRSCVRYSFCRSCFVYVYSACLCSLIVAVVHSVCR